MFIMPRIRHFQLAVLLLLFSTVSSAPNHLNENLKSTVSTERSLPNVEGNHNESSKSSVASSEAPRTLIMYGMLRWLFGIVKAMIQPARNMYFTMKPEITAFRCLSDSREFQDVTGFSGSDFEGYVYETPRTSDRLLLPNGPSSNDHVSDYEELSNEVYDSQLHQEIRPDALAEKNPRDNPSKSQTVLLRSGEVLRRFPRFVDEIGSLLKEGQAMNCIMPYMRERVTRWLDS